MERFFRYLLVFGAALVLIGTVLLFKQGSKPFDPFIAQSNTNTYLGPHGKVPGNPQLIRVQILVSDDPNPQGVQIVSAVFNGQEIPLKPRDIYGYRGQASFQVRPDHYSLRWTVRQDKVTWPRTTSHEEDVNVDSRDMWIQINIIGDKATIS
jgi:hypothetical protein